MLARHVNCSLNPTLSRRGDDVKTQVYSYLPVHMKSLMKIYVNVNFNPGLTEV